MNKKKRRRRSATTDMVEAYHKGKPFLRFLQEIEEQISWATGHTYTGHSMKRRENSWLLVVRAETKMGEKKVAFIESPRRMDCWRLLYIMCYFNNSAVRWKADRYG